MKVSDETHETQVQTSSGEHLGMARETSGSSHRNTSPRTSEPKRLDSSLVASLSVYLFAHLEVTTKFIRVIKILASILPNVIELASIITQISRKIKLRDQSI